MYSVMHSALLLFLVAPEVLAFTNISPATKAQLLQAITLTKGAAANITVAHQACDLWHALLEPTDPPLLRKDEIVGACLILYGSCLVRTGNDDLAIGQFEKALTCTSLSSTSLEDAILGRGRALQRLLRYREAKDQYLCLVSSGPAVCGAAACALRLGSVHEAGLILQEYVQQQQLIQRQSNNPMRLKEARDMLGVVNIITNKTGQHQSALTVAAKTPPLQEIVYSFLHRWTKTVADIIGHTADCTHAVPAYQGTVSYVELATVNVSPFDDYLLLCLDDKVLLHKLLSSPIHRDTTRPFWPPGMVSTCKNTSIIIQDQDKSALWIQKRRSGYGSHGNKVVTLEEAQKLALELDGESLLQQMVRPPLLLDGRKFSLRIYVVYFASAVDDAPDVYISTKGLVKLASVGPTDADIIDERVHMTNSGRGTAMTQKDLSDLKVSFLMNDWSFEALWSKLVRAVKTTMDIYHHSVIRQQTNHTPEQMRLASLGIPKILGFDFVLDEAQNPWMLEINRFPGLESRDKSDQGVKHQVLRDTWKLATVRAKMSKAEVNALFGDLLAHGNQSSLELIPSNNI
jgi:Tubulin-tyrosine ligase family